MLFLRPGFCTSWAPDYASFCIFHPCPVDCGGIARQQNSQHSVPGARYFELDPSERKPPISLLRVHFFSTRTAAASRALDKRTVVNFADRPILLKNSIPAFAVVILGVSNHHLINLRGSERVLEGRLFRGRSTRPLQMSFSTE